MLATGSGEGMVDFATARNVSFDLLGIKFVLAEAGVLPLVVASPTPGEPVGGLLGYDLIRRYVVELDYTARVLRLHAARGYRYRGRGQVVPVRMMDNNPFIPATVVLPGRGPVRGMFVVDSGAGTDVEFFSPFVERNRLLDTRSQTAEATAVGIGGASKIRIGRGTEVRIGRTVIAGPLVHFSLAERGDDATTIGAGLIGGGLLRQYRTVIFDHLRHRLIVEPATAR
jgi:hypothetical protein